MSLKKQTLWSLAPLLVSTVINLFSVPLFLRYLGTEMYAIWFYVLTFTGAFGFLDLGLGVAMGRYIGIALARNDQQAVRSYWATGHAFTSVLLLLMSIIFTFVGFYWGPEWFNVQPQNVLLLKKCFLAGGIGLFLSYYSQLWLILAQAHLEFAFLAKLRIFSTFAIVFPSLYLAKITGSPFAILNWSVFISFAQVGLLIFHARKSYQLRFFFHLFEWNRLKEMFLFTTKIFLDLLLSTFFGTADRLVLGKLASADAFTQYSIATNVGTRLSGLSISVMGPVFHHTSRAVGKDSVSEAAAVYNTTFDFVFGWFLLASVWSFIWAEPALTLWLGSVNGPKVAVIFPPLITAYCLMSMSNIAAAQLGPLNRVGTGLIIRLFTTVLMIVAIWIGWKIAGISGVAWGFLISRIGYMAKDLFVIRLIHGGGWLAISIWKQIFLQIGVGILWFALISFYHFSFATLLLFSFIHGLGVSLVLAYSTYKNRFA